MLPLAAGIYSGDRCNNVMRCDEGAYLNTTKLS